MSTMSPEEQRIAIAEACGWKILPPSIQSGRVVIYLNGEERGSYWTDSPDDAKGRAIEAAGIPDYLSDLNAMHEAEKVLMDAGKWVLYTENLGWVGAAPDRRILHATAPQRAEAFLRTIGKWNPEALRRAGEEVQGA